MSLNLVSRDGYRREGPTGSTRVWTTPVQTESARQAVQGDALSLEQKPPGKAPARKKRPAADDADREQQMGRALRSVYDEAVQEPVPDDLLDLLGKLG